MKEITARGALALAFIALVIASPDARSHGICLEFCQAAGAAAPAQMRCKLAHSRPASAIDKHERLTDVGQILDLSNKKLSDVQT